MSHTSRASEAPMGPPPHPARAFGLDGDAMALVIAQINRFAANSLQQVGWELAACGGEASDNLLRTLTQVGAMTSLHRRLSTPPRPGERIEDYCRGLCGDVVLALGRGEVRPRLAMCDTPLSCGRSLGVAILVVELMTNALKHGAAPREGGTVWVAMRPLCDGRLELSVSDSFAPPINPHPPRPRLIETLAHALSGELIIGVRPTYTTRIRFPVA